MSDMEVNAPQDEEDVFLIDVREPSELAQTGTIPNSINIPLSILEQTLQNATAAEFKSLYNRNKPSLDTPLEFGYQAGRRSLTAIKTAKKLGYVKCNVQRLTS